MWSFFFLFYIYIYIKKYLGIKIKWKMIVYESFINFLATYKRFKYETFSLKQIVVMTKSFLEWKLYKKVKIYLKIQLTKQIKSTFVYTKKFYIREKIISFPIILTILQIQTHYYFQISIIVWVSFWLFWLDGLDWIESLGTSSSRFFFVTTMIIIIIISSNKNNETETIIIINHFFLSLSFLSLSS